ncbi:MAG: CHAT domain-containing protein, partial [Planctomycetes bacterium]|nr:CHAT domain-containing protein [Planctomycetota bacterium]
FRELARHHYFYGNLLTAREILQTARAARLARDAAEDEELAGLEFDLGSVLHRLQEFPLAAQHLQTAYDIRLKLADRSPMQLAQTATALGQSRLETGEYETASKLFAAALADYDQVGPNANQESARVLLDLAKAQDALQQPDAALESCRRALQLAQEVFGKTSRNTLVFHNTLRVALRQQRRYAESQELLQQLQDLVRESPDADNFDRALFFGDLSLEERRRGSYAAGLPFAREALSYWEKVAADTTSPLGKMMQQQGGAGRFVRGARIAIFDCLTGQGRFGESQALQRQLLAEDLATAGPISPQVTQDLGFLVGSAVSRGSFSEAEQYARQWLTVAQLLGGAESGFPPHEAARAIAISLDRQGRLAEARPFYEMALPRPADGSAQPASASFDDLLARGQILSRLGDLEQAAACFRQAVELAAGPAGLDAYIRKPQASLALAVVLRDQGKFADATPLFERALQEQTQLSGEAHPSVVNILVQAASNRFAAGDLRGAEQLLTEVARLHPLVRLQIDVSGLERSAYAAANVPLDWLAGLLAARGAPVAAWERLEEHLGRGLLDEMSTRLAQPLTTAEQEHVEDLSYRLKSIDERLRGLQTTLARQPDDAAVRHSLEVWTAQRQRVLADWTNLQAEFVQRYGPASGQTFSLERIQSHLQADEALVAWIDLETTVPHEHQPGLHYACVLRKSLAPHWIRLPGSGPAGAWTSDDLELPTQLRVALATIESRNSELVTSLTSELQAQRFLPLEPLLQATPELPAVRRIIVLPSPALAAIPCQLLAGDRLVSYVPSGTVLTLLRERPRPATPPAEGLLAIGDPVVPAAPAAQPAAPAVPPDSGVLVLNVPAGSIGQAAGLQAGDVVQSYNGVATNSVADLVAAIDKRAQAAAGNFGKPDTPLTVWRAGQMQDLTARRGRLGINLSAALAQVAWPEWRRSQELLFLAQREGQLPPLPGSRLETSAIAHQFAQARLPHTRWLGPQATEAQLETWRRERRLAQVQYLHLASHALLNPTLPLDSSLLLSPAATATPAIANDTLADDGRVTAAQILRDWHLQSDLVVLSACETALGQPLAGEGLLGFSQAFLRAGTRSLIVSLWRVDDQATALLMHRLYQNLLATRPGLTKPLSKTEALAEAQHWLQQLPAADATQTLRDLATLAELPQYEPTLPPGEFPFAHPSFWSAFILIGDPQ